MAKFYASKRLGLWTLWNVEFNIPLCWGESLPEILSVAKKYGYGPWQKGGNA